MGLTLEEVAVEYDLTLAEVYAAIAFYYDNKSAIDESIGAAEALAESLRSQYPSLLQEKVKALGNVRADSLPS
jgi:ribosome-binding factor A